MKLLVVIDMQKDFIDGCLGTKEAVAILDKVRQKILTYRENGDLVIFTRDTHGENYLATQEGRKLPVPHCIKGTPGWEIHESLPVGDALVVDKPTFGSVELAHRVARMEDITAIELIGVCTDICVISNAMLLKASMPEMPIFVDGACCAGVTPESHDNALKAMAMCQIGV